MKNLFVGNLNFQTAEAELRVLFEAYGQVSRIHIAMDRETGRARGFAFVEMPNDEEAAKAMAGLDGKEVGGRTLKVNEARPRAASGGGPRGGGGGGYDRERDRGRGARGGNSRQGGRFSTEDYRDSPRQPREPRW